MIRNHSEAGQKLRKYMSSRGITIAGLAKSLGFSRASLVRKLDGKSEFSIGEAQAIAKCLRMYKDEILSVFWA